MDQTCSAIDVIMDIPWLLTFRVLDLPMKVPFINDLPVLNPGGLVPQVRTVDPAKHVLVSRVLIIRNYHGQSLCLLDESLSR